MKKTAGKLLFALAVAVSPVFAQAADADVLGISKTKPASGPFVELDGAYMVPYIHSIEKTRITFEMIPIPGGEITIGSPASENGRSEDEGPQFTVRVDPFWMAKTELTWGEYETFMRNYDILKRLESNEVRVVNESNQADAVTVPTPLYEPSFTFEYGDEKQQPAVTMTQYSAQQYTKWLSGITETQYRIPSAVEWEYAARAGSNTAYSFGDDPSELEKYAVFAGASAKRAAHVGSKLPNKFGLHDMHGNVWEWTVDQHNAKGYSEFAGKKLHWTEAIQWPTSDDARVARGGGWEDSAERLRSSAILFSVDEDWKDNDPNIPKSPWWYTNDPARGVGMRLIRSAKPLDKELITKFWNANDEDIEQVVDARLKEGRGIRGLPVPELIKEFQRKR